VGVVSYEIYLTHVVVYRVVERVHPRPWGGLEYVLVVVAAIAAGWVFHRVFGKPTQRWVRDRLAGRVAQAGKSILAPVAAQG
jgi:peptidoglycan/LPS O-acetylase OafA/YrhL